MSHDINVSPGRGLSGTRASWILGWNKRGEHRPYVETSSGTIQKELDFYQSPSGIFAAFDGYLFDQEKLLNDLDVRSGSSEAQLIALAYERWGSGLFDKLRGGFLLAIWDQRQEHLVIGRDAMGLHSCFYWHDNGQFVVSSSLDAILSQPEVPNTFNRAVIGEYIERSITSHQQTETFYESIHRLPSAHRLLVTRETFESIRYWDPVPPGFEWASDEELSQFEPLLERAVSRCLSAGADSIALSGGFDSVSIAVLAAEQLSGKSPLQALSMRFPDPICDEGATQMAVAHALQMPQLIKTLEESLEEGSHMRVNETLSRISPCPVLSIWQSFYTGLFSTAPSGCNRILFGTGGDDLLNVDLRYGADCLATLRLGALWRFFRVYQRTSAFPSAYVARVMLWDSAVKLEAKDLASRFLSHIAPRSKIWLRARMKPPAIVDRGLEEVLQSRRITAPAVSLAPGERRYVSALRSIVQHPMMMHELDQAYSWARQEGFTLFYPYFDQDFVAMLLRLRPELLLTGGKAKAPLRRLVAKRLPSVPLPSKKVDFSHMVNDVLRTDGRAQWDKIDGPTLLADLGIGRADTINSLMQDYFSGRSNKRAQAWRILSAEMWLRGRSGSCTITY